MNFFTALFLSYTTRHPSGYTYYDPDVPNFLVLYTYSSAAKFIEITSSYDEWFDFVVSVKCMRHTR